MRLPGWLRWMTEIFSDLLAFLLFFFALCLPGAPFAMVLAASVFPIILWLVPPSLASRLTLICGLSVIVVALLAFGPSSGFLREKWDGMMRFVVSSGKRRFRAWAGILAGLISVSTVVLPCVVSWLGLRLAIPEADLQWLLESKPVWGGWMFIWILWVAFILGQPHTLLVRIPFFGAMLLRMQLSFVDGVVGIRTPRAALRDRQRIFEAAEKDRRAG